MKIGFIGAGNMANAIFTGIKKAKILSPSDIYVNSKTNESLERVSKKYGYNINLDVHDIVKSSDIIFICVKPQVIEHVASDIKNDINKNQVIVSIVAGKTLDYLKEHFGTKNVIRIMPNTPCLVGAGISAISLEQNYFDSDESLKEKFEEVKKIVQAMGEYEVVDEKYIDAITQVSGASPAWIFMLIEALADGGVLCGMPREMAYKFASNAVYGAGKLSKDKNIHPGILKDMVTSPAGTTIEGVKVLEEKGYRGALIDAVVAAYNKTKKI